MARSIVNEDLYGLLEVSPNASQRVIHSAFRVLAAHYHPDTNKDRKAEEIAKKISEAYSILSDPDQRVKYDATRKKYHENIIGNYKILECITDEGGFGPTYKAEHILVGEPVCIKHCHKITSQSAEILIEEARAMWDLRHYAIPSVRDVIKMEDGSVALVTSYIPGLTLEKIVEKVGRLDAEHVTWITERVLNALKYMHYHKIVHGDIKPQNVIVQPESHIVVVVDFGLAAIKPSGLAHNKGYTPYFSPPEQARKGDTVLLPESDFYSLGMMMIYALGGSLDHVKRREIPENTPKPLCDFIKKLIVRDVLARPNWGKGDLFEEIQKVRELSFGRASSNFKPIKGI